MLGMKTRPNTHIYAPSYKTFERKRASGCGDEAAEYGLTGHLHDHQFRYILACRKPTAKSAYRTALAVSLSCVFCVPLYIFSAPRQAVATR